ncbi:cytochrome P450 [Clohesyomyces aquaticus]|uniref:Cytochrome P450 n=1 Tax=Clohesyomyces aquaticus TaxID=1231657 RepID=A0A1Y1YVY2_9PLEO|nr:cytochrome P450 [Clohesyomyces aquaticus]
MQTIIAAIVGTSVAVIVGVSAWLRLGQDPREPPLITASVPFLGPILGIMKRGNKYYGDLRDRYRLPIYTLRMPGARIYVVNSPKLFTAIQRQHKILPHAPIGINAVKRICGASAKANTILDENMSGEHGEWGYAQTYYKSMHESLSAGGGLDFMNRTMIKVLSNQITTGRFQGGLKVKLFQWTRHEITLATTNTVYGPLNPFKDERAEKTFWDFEHGMISLLLHPYPGITARKTIKQRDILAEEYYRFFQSGGQEQGSPLLRTVFDISKGQGVPLEDIAKFECLSTIAALGNTVPGTFWILYHVYSDPVILAVCREELAKIVTTSRTEEGLLTNTIDISRVKSECPVLLSLWQEILRYHTSGISVRMALEDHLLENQFLLKKGSTLIMPGHVLHTDEGLWGPDVDKFDYERFIRHPSKKRHNPVAFRGFGGGKTLCPGRHFATTEILAMTAMMVTQFDVIPVQGKWIEATTHNTSIWAVTPGPDEDIEVEITIRNGVDETVDWRYTLSDTDKPIALAAEDFATLGTESKE